MSNQTLNKNHLDANSNIIPDIATKIRDLSATKHVYLKLIMQMYPMSVHPMLTVYANPLIRLLQSIINIYKLDVLLELEDGLVSILVTYIYDINDLIKGQLDLKKYEPRHKNLLAVHQQIDYHLEHDDHRGLEELKTTLFLI